jgi:hypothetical protein
VVTAVTDSSGESPWAAGLFARQAPGELPPLPRRGMVPRFDFSVLTVIRQADDSIPRHFAEFARVRLRYVGNELHGRR